MVSRQSPTTSAPDVPEYKGYKREAVDAAFERTLAKREEVRARLMGSIPTWYLPWGHLAATVGIGVVVLVVALTQIHGLALRELYVIPVTLILANYFEWRVHQKLLHRRLWPLQELYDRHTPQHHVVFVESDMAIRSTREFRLVLLPAIGVLGIVLADAPLALLFGRLAGGNVGWLFLVSSALALISYEILHLTYHLSPDSVIGGSRLVSALRRHHARHHDPRLMQK